MGLDVVTPDPPRIYREPRDDEYVTDETRRADIQQYLFGSENAWEEGFSEWATDTTLSEDEFQQVADVGLFDAFDFYWDEEAEIIAYTAPQIPDDWESTEAFSNFDSWSVVSAINEELDDLGETVAGMLTDYYLTWETEERVVKMFGAQYNARDDTLTDLQNAEEDEAE